MDQLRAPVIRLPEEPAPFLPPFVAHQLSEHRFIYLRQLHMNVIITLGRPSGVGVRFGGRWASFLPFSTAGIANSQPSSGTGASEGLTTMDMFTLARLSLVYLISAQFASDRQSDRDISTRELDKHSS